MLGWDSTVTVVLRSYDPDGDRLTTTLNKTPSYGQIFDLQGERLYPGDVVEVVNETAQIVYVQDSADGSTLRDNFTYAVTDGGDPVTASVVIEPYALPEPTDRTVTQPAGAHAHTHARVHAAP